MVPRPVGFDSGSACDGFSQVPSPTSSSEARRRRTKEVPAALGVAVPTPTLQLAKVLASGFLVTCRFNGQLHCGSSGRSVCDVDPHAGHGKPPGDTAADSSSHGCPVAPRGGWRPFGVLAGGGTSAYSA